MLRPFASRIRAGSARLFVAFEASRWGVAIALAAAPALLLVTLIAAGAAVGDAMREPERVREAFARYISGLITAATMAVGFAALAMRRGIKGLGELTESVRADAEFADQARAFTGKPDAAAVGPLVADLLDALAAKADATRTEGDARAFTQELSRQARDVARAMREARARPDALLRASLDFEGETAAHLARRHGLEELERGVRLVDIGRAYVRTLATQWGLTRMAQGIASTSFVAVVVATFLVLGFGSLGSRAADAAVLGCATFAVTLPLTVFVSFVARFIFLHQHTLPLGHFVLGPENPRAAQR